jgi:hypothetical protein
VDVIVAANVMSKGCVQVSLCIGPAVSAALRAFSSLGEVEMVGKSRVRSSRTAVVSAGFDAPWSGGNGASRHWAVVLSLCSSSCVAVVINRQECGDG